MMLFTNLLLVSYSAIPALTFAVMFKSEQKMVLVKVQFSSLYVFFPALKG